MLDYRKTAFLKSATAIAHFPDPDMPEVAIVGRSNVGKSSLLNTLCDHKGMARVSKTPGRTQLINFFTVDNRARIVDLPGYGYADVPENIQRTWDKMMHDYLTGRELLLGLLLLIDIRRMPSEHDKLMLSWCIERGLPVLIVLTKSDKAGRNEAFNQQHKIAKSLGISPEQVLQTSASKKSGIDELRHSLDALFDDYFESLNND